MRLAEDARFPMNSWLLAGSSVVKEDLLCRAWYLTDPANTKGKEIL